MPRGPSIPPLIPRSVHVLALAVALPIAVLGHGCAPPRPERPNVLLVTVDTLRADHLGAFGDTLVDTPALDRLAERALIFEDATTAIPITTPSLASLLSGVVPRRHGTLNNTYDLEFDGPTLPEILSAAGWRTGAFLPSFLADKDGFRAGFDEYDFPPLAEGLRTADTVVHRAATWLQGVEDDGGGPWFCWIHVLEPHSPYEPGSELEAKYLPAGVESVPARLRRECIGVERFEYEPADVEIVRALYRGEVEATDRALTPLLAWVDEHRAGGARADAGEVLLVLTADHGEMLYEHEQYVGHTAWLFEPMLRVPLLVRLPGDARMGRVSAPAGLIDVLPTVLGALDLPAPGRQGRNLLAEEERDAERVLVHETFAPEGHYDQQALRRGQWKYMRPIAELREDTGRANGSRLYDLARDPGERANLASERAALTGELEQEFTHWAARQPYPRAGPAPDVSDELIEALGFLGYTEGEFRETPDADGGP